MMIRFSRLTALALASVSTLALTAAARAQPVYNWTGFYVGLNAGASWGRSDAASALPCSNVASPPGYLCQVGFPGVAPALAAAGTGSLNEAGFTGGFQAGYNWQTGNVVFGLEADFGAFDIGASRTISQAYPLGMGGPGGAFTIGNAVDTDWLFTARGRLGWTVNNVLIYATGGLAVTNIKTTNSYVDTSFAAATGTWASSATRAGYVIGGGLEWAFARNWTVKAEYLFLDFGSVTASGLITSPAGPYAEAISTTVDVTAHVARLGVNFRF